MQAEASPPQMLVLPVSQCPRYLRLVGVLCGRRRLGAG